MNSMSSLVVVILQSPQCRVLHAGGKEAEAQGWCFGKMLHFSENQSVNDPQSPLWVQAQTALDTLLWKHSVFNFYSLCCIRMQAFSLCRMQIYLVSRTGLYNLCYLLHRLSLRGHCTQRVMMSARLYSIRRIIGSSPNNKLRFIELVIYLRCTHCFLRLIWGISILVGDYSKWRLRC